MDEPSGMRARRMRPIFGPNSSAAMITSDLLSLPRPRCPSVIPPTWVSSTSTRPLSLSRPGRTIARPQFCAATSKQFDSCPNPIRAGKTQRTGSVLLTGHGAIYRATPQLQGQMAVLENSPSHISRHGGLVLTGGTEICHAPAPRQPNFSPPALWTDKSVRPTQRRQVGTTLLFSGKPAFHLQKRPRIVLYHPFPLHVVVTGVNRIAL